MGGGNAFQEAGANCTGQGMDVNKQMCPVSVIKGVILTENKKNTPQQLSWEGRPMELGA